MATATNKTYAVVERNREAAKARLRLAVRQGLARAYIPPPKLTLSEWADANRYLSAESAALPGRWRTSNEPLAKTIMDAASDPLVEKITVMMAAQLAKTELILNLVGYYAHGDPSPILLVQNSIEEAENFSKQRLDPMIRDTPVLTELFGGRSRDGSDTMRNKAFPGGYVALAGANAPRGLASRPIRVVLMDEIDGYPASSGKEGDPVSLAEKRTTTFWNRKVVLASTPTIKGQSRIEASFLEGDRRRYHVPCPHCGVRQKLIFGDADSIGGVKWERGADGEGDSDTAHYVCNPEASDPETGELGCGEPWTEADRIDAIDVGVWIAEREFKGHASFHASQLSSRRVPLQRVVKEFLEVRKFPDRLKTFVNTVLGETWEDDGVKVDPDSLLARREDYQAGYLEQYDHAYQWIAGETLPPGVGVITSAVDIQDNRWEGEHCGWGVNEERHSLDYKVHMGDPTTPEFWEALDEFLLRRFLHPTGQVMTVAAACIDTGGHHTQAVHDFCRVRGNRRVFGIKGAGGPGRKIWPDKATKNMAKKTDTYILGVDQAKSAMQKRLTIKTPGPGYCHFPRRHPYDQAYFNMVTAEKAMLKYKFGRPIKEWHCPDGARNEAWDCIVYNYAAYFSTPVDIALRLHELNAAAEKRAASPQPTAPTAIPSAGRRRGVRAGGATA